MFVLLSTACMVWLVVIIFYMLYGVVCVFG